MTPHDIVFSKEVGAAGGPVALALALAVLAEGGRACRCDGDFARLLGCSVRSMQTARTALVKLGVLTYTAGQKGRPTVYRSAGVGEVSETGDRTPAPLAPPPPPPPSAQKPEAGGGAAGEEAPPAVPATRGAAVRVRKPMATDPLFDVIAEFVGPVAAKQSSGRVAKLAHAMLGAGLTPERLAAELPAVWQKYYGWRKVLDLDTITVSWPCILNPPKTTTPKGSTGGAIDLARRAVDAAGGKNPWD